MSEHSKTPWMIEDGWIYTVREDGQAGVCVARPGDWQAYLRDKNLSKETVAANMEFVVRAVNSHDALVAALKACGSVTKAYAGDGLLTQIDAVLALANGVSAPSQRCAPESPDQLARTEEVQS